MRTTREVFEDHLRLAREGEVEADLERNYARDVKVLIDGGVVDGIDGVLALARRLEEELPRPRFECRTKTVAGEIAFLEWAAEADGARVTDGADTFLIRGGKVLVQTIHYTVEPA